MDGSKAGPPKEIPSELDATTEEAYASNSNLLQEFIKISNIDKAWTFDSGDGMGTQAMFSISQPNLLANKKRKFNLSTTISKENKNSVTFQWSPFPVEMTGASTIVPSPSGSKLLVVRNPENESPTQFEIWSQSQLEKEFHIPQTVHGSVYVDGWFEGISWNSNENFIAYVAEEPSPPKPTFSHGYKKGGSSDKDCDTWEGQGDWEEDWGETYAGKRQPTLFVININSGEVEAVKGISKSLSIGQVVWAPSAEGLYQYLVFVGWSSNPRKLGIKYCYNRRCALYAARVLLHKSEANELELKDNSFEDFPVVNLTQSISSAFFPCFSPDGKFLVFLSAKCSVDSGAHSATDSLHKIEWPTNGKLSPSETIFDVIPVVLCAEDGCFPGLYCSSILINPWLSDGHTMILSSVWCSSQVIISVNVLSGELLRISPTESNFSWNVLTLDGDNIIAVCSSPVNVPQIKYGYLAEKDTWSWLNVSSPIYRCSEKVRSLLSSLQFSIMKIPVKDASADMTKGAKKPFEAIFVSSKSKRDGACDPLIVLLHGGPHSVWTTSFSKSSAFLSSVGYSLLIINYRGSLGFGEEALQSLPRNVGSQDVNDVLTAIDHVIDMGLASPSKLTVLGGSHGGFLTTHLIGQAPDKFVAAAVRNPVCNLALMVGTTDIPDWCYVESYGSKGKNSFTESPSPDELTLFYSKSPISHLSKVKTPTLFLLGAQDLRVPVSNGLQYARALKEKGVETKVIVFPKDVHGIDRDNSFEDFRVVNLTPSISSAFFPLFSPDGKFLVFLSAKCSVDSGAHSATDSLHKIEWPTNGKLSPSETIFDVIPVVLCAEDGCFPGLYSSSILINPWLSDGHTMILSSIWGSSQVIISVNILSGELLRISPTDSNFSWNVLTLDGDNIIAVCSSPVDVPQIKYGYLAEKDTWSWLNVSSPICRCSEKVISLLSSLQFSIMKIPVKDASADLTKGAKKPFEAIFVSSKSKRDGACDPLVVLLHGGPHSVWTSSFSKASAFLSSIGYSLLIVNYRGSLGFGEEALQSLPGNVGSQDVNDVLTAIDHVIDMGLASPSKLTVLGGSHGGFLTTHLIGQQVSYFTHSKVKTPTLFLLGAQDLRLPVSNGLQYARALKEKGVETKVIMFPKDVHGIDRPQSDFESLLNIGLWFKKYCK
ncbi:hypothetical protein Ddye_022341 [Dipteronia dyeriana]|uniref:acylaminoacyl-peptidase n=1 Tax=Dipteronia dyeriana TaxID=168575 RepID=A0AAD9WXR2_9ROSI|nr:hypothetical protein Ddye_022341 [Dipteronia dyeriana]